MPMINQLPKQDTISDGDLLPVWVSSQSDARRIPASVLKAYFQETDEEEAEDEREQAKTVIITPAAVASSYVVPFDPAHSEFWLVVEPSGASVPSLAVTLPDLDETGTGYEFMISTIRPITALTFIGAGGAQVFSGLSALTANQTLKLRFVVATNSWYTIT